MDRELKKIKRRQVFDSVIGKELIPVNDIGQRIKDVREALGLTQKQVADRIGLKQASLARIEKDASACSFKTIMKISSAMECGLLCSIYSSKKLEESILEQARKKAKRELDRVFSNMAFEKQSPGKKTYDARFNELVDGYVKEPGPKLWSE